MNFTLYFKNQLKNNHFTTTFCETMVGIDLISKCLNFKSGHGVHATFLRANYKMLQNGPITLSGEKLILIFFCRKWESPRSS